ncbi:MAG: N-acylneuraminate-9-phosphate synthase, partial [Nitrososphaeria archaeon]|nr:N-acylneuraminate-9-phosphate synthase [Nitrososphaeria archaeon]
MPNSKVFIIAEAGSNWKVGSYNADLKRAKKLIQIAAQSGADAI